MAKQLAAMIAAGRELWTTDAVLLEIAAAFSHPDHRSAAISIWDEFHGGDPRCRVCQAAGTRLDQAVELFRERSDKAWSLTDCLSFVVMHEEQLVDALTADRHFTQALVSGHFWWKGPFFRDALGSEQSPCLLTSQDPLLVVQLIGKALVAMADEKLSSGD